MNLVVVNNTMGTQTLVTDEDLVNFTQYVRDGEVIERFEYVKVVTKTGCGGSIATTSVILSSLALATLVLIFVAKKKKKIGGN